MHSGENRRIGLLSIGLLIISPAAAPALRLWADNVHQVPNAYKLFLVVGGFALFGLVAFSWLRHRLDDPRIGAFVTFFVLLAATSGGQVLADRSWALRWLVALAALSIAVGIVFRLRDWWVLDAFALGCALALVVPPLVTGASEWVSNREPVGGPSVARPSPRMLEQPDIVLVIVDGYTSLPVLSQLFGYTDSELRNDLERHGFEVPEAAFSPYPMTHLTVSSFLELDYVAQETLSTSTSDGRTLAEVMSGDSYLVALLAESGYRITMVEPGWHLSTCGSQVDVCVTAPFIDEGVGVVLSQSLVWSFVQPSVGGAFTHGARHAMRWATDNLNALVTNDVPDFVFVHVLAPHPPHFLDAACRVVDSDRLLLGTGAVLTGVDPATVRARIQGYVDQVKCVNEFIRDVAAAVVGSDSLVLIAGDHGSNTKSQLDQSPGEWTEPQVLERMSVFLAVKPTIGCENVSSRVTVALFRALVSCAGGLGLDPIADRSFLVSLAQPSGGQPDMRVLPSDEVERLASCLGRLDESLDC